MKDNWVFVLKSRDDNYEYQIATFPTFTKVKLTTKILKGLWYVTKFYLLVT